MKEDNQIQPSVVVRWLPEQNEIRHEAEALRRQELQAEKARRRAEQLKRREASHQRRQRVKARQELQDRVFAQMQKVTQLRPEKKLTPPGFWTGVGIGLGALAVTAAGLGLFKLLQGKARQDALESFKPLPLGLSIELGSLTGVWYELARFPHGQEKGAVGSRIEVSRKDDRELDVTYSCELDGFHGRQRESSYKVCIDDDSHVKLRVFGPIVYDYLLIEQDADFLVIGGADRRHLWILGRGPSLDPTRFDNIVTRMTNRGFDMSRLVLVPQLPQPALARTPNSGPKGMW